MNKKENLEAAALGYFDLSTQDKEAVATYLKKKFEEIKLLEKEVSEPDEQN